MERGREKRARFLEWLKEEEERPVIKPRRARVLGVFSCKGGVGKTTTVVSIAAHLNRRMKEEILVVDANLMAPNLGLHLGELNPKVTIHDVLSHRVAVEAAILKCRGLHAVLGSIAFGEEVHLVDLRGHLEPLMGKYKVILLDSAPGLGPEVISAMKACDEILVVTNPYVPTIASTLKTFTAAERYKIPIVGVVVNRVLGEPFELSEGEIRKALGWPVITNIPEDPKVREATAAGVPVVDRTPDSPAAKRFMKVGDYLIERL
ncbi:MAG: P-loop NTPase [Candidatus Hadarchaeales archaeon]